jgi:transposase
MEILAIAIWRLAHAIAAWPPSPDLNPIEMAFSKLKTLLRKKRPELTTTCGKPSEVCGPVHTERLLDLFQRSRVRCLLIARCSSWCVRPGGQEMS